eukprot:3932137-Rhodomonas_salina.1
MVIFNACFSDGLSQGLAERVDFAIGHVGPVADAAAINLSRDFYSSIAASRWLRKSFEAAWAPQRTFYADWQTPRRSPSHHPQPLHHRNLFQQRV